MSSTVIAKPKGALFVGRRFELSLTKEPIRTIRNPSDGTIVDKTAGERINFSQGQFQTADEETLGWLRRHPLYGDRQEGFWEQEMPAPEPSAEELDAIVEATAHGDVERLEAIIAAEREGWQRETVLHVAQGSLDRVLGLLAQLEAERGGKEK